MIAIRFDYDGTSEQNDDADNSTFVGSWGQLFVALTSQLFWNIPWNGGMARPVTHDDSRRHAAQLPLPGGLRRGSRRRQVS